MTRCSLNRRALSGVVCITLLFASSPAWSEDPASPPEQSASPSAETQPSQGDVQERAVPQLPGLQRPPVPPQNVPPQAPSAAIRPNTQVPLAQHPQGNQMMATALKNASMLEIKFTFLDKTYENDVYGPRNPLTGKRVRLSCVRLKATSGFGMRVDHPDFALSTQGLTITENISRLSANGITMKWQLGPCLEHAGGFGLVLTDVKFVYKAKPILAFDGDGFCRLAWNADPDEFRVAIGGMNILGMQNDLDKLAKDAVREGINFTLSGIFGTLVKNELTKVTHDLCGNKMTFRSR